LLLTRRVRDGDIRTAQRAIAETAEAPASKD
jgi:hypothetical protein